MWPLICFLSWRSSLTHIAATCCRFPLECSAVLTQDMSQLHLLAPYLCRALGYPKPTAPLPVLFARRRRGLRLCFLSSLLSCATAATTGSATATAIACRSQTRAFAPAHTAVQMTQLPGLRSSARQCTLFVSYHQSQPFVAVFISLEQLKRFGNQLGEFN